MNKLRGTASRNVKEHPGLCPIPPAVNGVWGRAPDHICGYGVRGRAGSAPFVAGAALVCLYKQHSVRIKILAGQLSEAAQEVGDGELCSFLT